jgi:hypothetical protein
MTNFLDIIHCPNLIKKLTVQKLLVGGGGGHTEDRQTGALISLLLYLESRPKKLRFRDWNLSCLQVKPTYGGPFNRVGLCVWRR